MNSKPFLFSSPCIPTLLPTSFSGSPREKKDMEQIIDEWNMRACVSTLCRTWTKKRPANTAQNMLFVVYNVQGLNTHITDLDVLINTHTPHICVLTGVGTATKKPPHIPGYTLLAQAGENAFGGVALLHRSSMKCKEIARESNLIIVETDVGKSPLRIGAIYVPPSTSPPYQTLEKHANNSFVIFGDFNAKHTH